MAIVSEVDNNNICYKQIAEALWGLLDDIDSLSDAIKPTSLIGYSRYYHSAMEFARQRFNYLTSDGYNLFLRKKCNQKILDKDKAPNEQA